MADWRQRANVPVTETRPILGKAAIDNNQTPSYVSLDVGYSLFAGAFRVEFARKVPHSGTPEANPAVAS